MENAVYWYDAVIIFGRDSQQVLFKSDHLYEFGDRIVKRYDSGAVVILIIKYGYGSAFPAHELTRLKSASLWPPIISEI